VALAMASIATYIAHIVGIRLPILFSQLHLLQVRCGQLSGTALYFAVYIILPLVIGIGLMVNTPATRSPKWQVHIGSRPDTSVTAPVTVVNETLFVTAVEPQPGRYPWNANNYLQALNAADGRLKWHFEAGGYGAAKPIMRDGVVVLSSFPFFPLYGVDAITGVSKWQFSVSNQDLSQPVVKDGVIYMACACRRYSGLGPNGRVLAIDAQSGESKWEIDIEQPLDTEPAVSADSVYYVDKIGLHAVERDTGKERWAFPVKYAWSSSPVVLNDTVYFGVYSDLYAVSTETGAERWRMAMEQGMIDSVTIVQDTAYVGVSVFCDMFGCGPQGYLYAVNLLKRHIKWRFDDGPPRGVVENPGTVYFSAHQVLYALERFTGKTEWVFQSGQYLLPPTLANGTIYIGGNKGDLYAISVP
jgi:outer membrane protein assembly factor BamB